MAVQSNGPLPFSLPADIYSRPARPLLLTKRTQQQSCKRDLFPFSILFLFYFFGFSNYCISLYIAINLPHLSFYMPRFFFPLNFSLHIRAFSVLCFINHPPPLLVLRHYSPSPEMVGHSLLPEEKKSAEWIRTLLHSSFGHCDDHQHLKYNEKNVFCIDCELSLCRHCKEAHTLHRRIQIYKYVYQDVVRHSELQKYFDCSRIQTYISNNEKIIHLNPRLSSKSPKPSKRDKCVDVGSPESQSQDTKMSSKSKSGGGTCEECGKHLQDERNCFCSISCKISVLSVEPKLIKSPKPEVSDHSLNDNQNSETESTISEEEPYERADVVIPRKRPRKAIPHRSPFVLFS